MFSHPTPSTNKNTFVSNVIIPGGISSHPCAVSRKIRGSTSIAKSDILSETASKVAKKVAEKG